jgi:WD40 repeat protein
LSGHNGPITAVKFNRKGADLVTVGMDGCAMTWDVATGTLRQKMQYHQGVRL